MQHLATRVGRRAVRGAAIVAAALAALAVPEPASAQGDIVLQASRAARRAGAWRVVNDPTAISGSVMRNADRGAAKITRALASPRDYFEVTFQARANTPYRLWLRGRAQSSHWGNDSVFVQFDRSVTASGAATYRIGTTSAAEVNLESCAGCRQISGWVWQDNGYGRGVLGPTIRFNRSGTQRLRVQTREDGLSIDQIVLSPSAYMRTAPTRTARRPSAPAGGGSGSGGSSSGPRDNDDDDDDRGNRDPEPASPPSSSNVIRVLDWNIHHGVGTDGRYDIARIAAAIASTGANVVSLNEVERYTGWGNEDQPERFAALLRSRTGRRWYYNFAQNSGNSRGQGNLLLTTFPIESDDDHTLSYTRSVARVAIIVNGIRVNLFSTHLDANSSSRRSTQIRELLNWADNFPEQRILLGDFNASPSKSEIRLMTAGHVDAWAAAQRARTAVAFSGNSAGNTRRSRIDYVFYSDGASRLRLTQARVFDTRDSRGVSPSDHRPLMATFQVR